jgi:hypothetical protein
MSEGRTGAAQRLGSGTTRLVRAWRALPHESRLAGFASIGLFATLFLPWYQVTLIAPAKTAKLQSASAAITGWGAFSFVEAAVLVVAAGVLILLFQRAEGRAFHLPGGDGGVITAAGLWTCVLIVWRIFDKQGATTNGPSATTSGIEWGIFVALATAAFLAYSGTRIRAAHRPEPPLPGEADAPAGSNAAATTARYSAGSATPATAATAAPAASSRRRSVPPRSEEADRLARRRPTDRGADRSPARPARTTPGADLTRSANRAPEADPARAPEADPARPPETAPVPRRRRVSAAELFERVVPDDPPAVPFGRVKSADVDATLRMAPRQTRKEHAPDEQLTIPTADEDDTLRLERGAGGDDTRRLDRD